MPILSDIETLKATGASNVPQQTGELSNETISKRQNLIVFGAIGATAILLANKKTRKLGYLALAGLGLATVMILKSY